MIKVGDDVEMTQLKLIGQVSAVANNWYTVEIEGEYFGNFKDNELKEVKSMNKKQKLLSDLVDSSTVNDNHQSVIVVEDAIEMIEKALEGCIIDKSELLNRLSVAFEEANPDARVMAGIDTAIDIVEASNE